MIKLIDLLREIKVNDPTLTPKKVEHLVLFSPISDETVNKIFNKFKSWKNQGPHYKIAPFIQELSKEELYKLYQEIKKAEKELENGNL